MKPYNVSLETLEKQYHTNFTQGLTQKEAQERIDRYGLNELTRIKAHSWIMLFARQFKNPLIYVLLIAALIIFATGHMQDGLMISFVLLFNAMLGSWQEYRAQKTFESLQQYVTMMGIVIRNGQKQVIEARFLTLGDIIFVQEGDQVPADARIIQAADLQINESLLTGESTPVTKTQNLPDQLEHELPVFQQQTMLFKGTAVLSGNAYAVVVAIGEKTEVGKISQTIHVDTHTPLQQQLETLSRWLLIGIAVFCVALLCIGLYFHKPLIELLITLSSLFVAVIPEGLPLIFTLALASGVYTMARKKVLVKRLQAVEGLGRVDVIVVDKTGTLTHNQMMVITIYTNATYYDVSGSGYTPTGNITTNNQILTSEQNKQLEILAYACALLNDSVITQDNGQWYVKGEPIEAALGIFAEKLGITKQQALEKYTLIRDIPFTSETRMHIAWFSTGNTTIGFTIGAPEAIMQMSSSVTLQDQEALAQLTSQGLRVIGLAYLEPITTDTLEIKKSTFLALFGIQDAIRSDVKPMIKHAQQAGLDIIMATGDHKQTATFVGRSTGILTDDYTLLEGSELQTLNQATLLDKLDTIRVFARVTPQDKLLLISLLHQKNKLVAMTGYGVNDVPSLVAADIGIAMGITGTQVARDAADLVLLDDSFASIIYAIEEGRHIFYTLRRTLVYLLATNLSEILVILGALALNIPLPLLPIHILWLNVVTDGFLDIALVFEPKEKNLLDKQWLKKTQQAGLINKQLISRIFYLALPMAIGPLFLFYMTYQKNITLARTLVLVCMAFSQWFNAWNCRSETISLTRLPLLANKWLIAATILVVSLQFLIVYVPWLQNIFDITSLTPIDWAHTSALAFSVIVFEELRKAAVSIFKHT